MNDVCVFHLLLLCLLYHLCAHADLIFLCDASEYPLVNKTTIVSREELLRRYPDVMVGMGRSKDLGQTGPDDAGDALTKTTIRVGEGGCLLSFIVEQNIISTFTTLLSTGLCC